MDLSFTASLRLCRKVCKPIIAPRDSDLNKRCSLCSFSSFSTSSDATEWWPCLLRWTVRAAGLFLRHNSSNVGFLKRLFLYQYNSGLNREFNWSIVSAHRIVEIRRKKGKAPWKRWTEEIGKVDTATKTVNQEVVWATLLSSFPLIKQNIYWTDSRSVPISSCEISLDIKIWYKWYAGKQENAQNDIYM